MKIVYNNIIPVKGFSAINLFGVIFARKEYKELSNITVNHEAIHTAQMKELLYIPFYIIYGLEYFIKTFKYGFKDTYDHISFEKEAYEHQKDLSYLNDRKHYTWCKNIL